MSRQQQVQIGLGAALIVVGLALAWTGEALLVLVGWLVMFVGMALTLIFDSLIIRLGGGFLLSCLFVIPFLPSSTSVTAESEPVEPAVLIQADSASPEGCHPDVQVKAKVAYRRSRTAEPALERIYDQCVHFERGVGDAGESVAVILRANGEYHDATLELYFPDMLSWDAERIKVKDGVVAGGKVKGEEAYVAWQDFTPAVPSEFHANYDRTEGQFEILEHGGSVGVGFRGTLEATLGAGKVVDIAVAVLVRSR